MCPISRTTFFKEDKANRIEMIGNKKREIDKFSKMAFYGSY
jgi:hypothetical protein